MKISHVSQSLHPLAVCLALVLGVPTPAQATDPAPVYVQNCLDHGAGSLRQAIIDGPNGAPIDLTHLTCGGIILTSGRIDVNRNLLIRGPGAALFSIDGARLDRVFNQNSGGTLALYGVTIEKGYTNSFGGGCIYSAGALDLTDSVVRDCHVADFGSSTTLKGGGVLVDGALILTRSAIVDNDVYSDIGSAIGGGAVVGGSAVLDHALIDGNSVGSGSGNVSAVGGLDVTGALLMTYSTVSNNRALGLPNAPGLVGGLRAFSTTTIAQSTISGNSTDGGVGGVNIIAPAGTTVAIGDSTISGNSAAQISGLATSGSASIVNSTIAFNRETGSSNRGALRISTGSATLQSTIVAANTSDNGAVLNIALGFNTTLDGAKNLIGPSGPFVPPSDTITADPKLFPLHDNGGPTKTHALQPGSPAVGAGNAVSGYSTDQRGNGYPRVVGGTPDIGAFEGVDTESIFFAAFD